MRISDNQSLILGPPGTGKTSHVLNKIDELLQAGESPDRIAFVSFTKKAIAEATGRAGEKFSLKPKQLPMFKTVHAMCFAALGIGKNDVVGKEHYRELGEWLGYRFEGTWDEAEGVPIGSEKGDTLLFLDNLARITQRPLREVWEENYHECEWEELERFQEGYQDFKSSKYIMDFTDMLSAYIAMCDSSPARQVIVDEAQDLSSLQWSVLKHAYGNVKQTIIAGDDDQCQPAGTMVNTTKGVKPIELLDPSSDELLTYAQCDSMVYGLRSGGYLFEKSVRNYTGKLTVVEAGELRSKYTSSHKCLIKWNTERSEEKKHVVYLMGKNNNYRIGRCELWHGNGLKLNIRTNVERAHSAWILRVCDTVDEARIYEQVYSAKYSLPQICFEGTYSKEVSDSVFNLIDTKANALKLLKDFDLDVRYPLVDKLYNPYSKSGAQIMEIKACNLISDIMCVPIYENSSRVKTWLPIKVARETVVNTPVYSLDVEKYHTYIADGIITHNSIYKWSGADVNAFLSLEGDKTILSQSYRLPRSVYDIANGIVNKIENRFDKPFDPRNSEGEVNFLNSLEEVILNDESTLFLVRNTYLGKRVQDYMHRVGIPYTNKYGYSSVRSAHIKAIECVEKLRKAEKVTGAEVKAMYDSMRVGEYLARGFKVKVANIKDTDLFDFTTLRNNFGLLDVAPWQNVLSGIGDDLITYYQRLGANGYGLSAAPKCSISTIHAAKGGEADHVILLSDMAYRSYQEYVKQPDNERRVAYVGVTRAKEKLTIVLPSSKLYYDYYGESQ